MNNKENVFGPEKWLGKPELAADIIISLLVKNYVNHNITNNRQKLVDDIKDGKLLPWITGDESACAALIKQNETDVEIGRAACDPRAVGGKSGPIFTAVARWTESEVFSDSKVLRAEIRTAKPTKEVPGGQATQAIFLNKLGFLPTAIGPFFHHGIPDRQEMFMLANITKDRKEILKMAQGIIMPEGTACCLEESKMLCRFWRINFGCEPRIVKTELANEIGFAISDVGPFIVLTPNQDQLINWRNNIDTHFKNGHRFALAKLNLNNMELPEISKGIFDLRGKGFKLVGFEPVLNRNEWTMDLLMGKLSPTGRTNLVMPSFSEGVVSHEMEENLLNVSINWRKNEKQD